MSELNVTGVSDKEIKLLYKSFNILKRGGVVRIVEEETNLKKIKEVLSFSSINKFGGHSLVRDLFEVKSNDAIYYIAHIEHDPRFLYPDRQSYINYGLEYLIWGVCKLTHINYDGIYLEPKKETVDNSIVKFFNAVFKNKNELLEQNLGDYYTIKGDAEVCQSFFTEDRLRIFRRSKDLYFNIQNGFVFCGFYDKLGSQTHILKEIFGQIHSTTIPISEW